MATKPKKAPQTGASAPPSAELAEGCVWMLRDTDGAAPEFTQVHVASGSVEVMRALGWVEIQEQD